MDKSIVNNFNVLLNLVIFAVSMANPIPKHSIMRGKNQNNLSGVNLNMKQVLSRVLMVIVSAKRSSKKLVLFVKSKGISVRKKCTKQNH
jgi:hypothetical protein